MDTIRFNSLRNNAMKIVAATYGMSKDIFAACVRFQFHVALFPVHFTIGGFSYICEKYSFWFKKHSSSLEPSNDVIVGRARRIWNNGLALCARCSAKINTEKNVDLNNSVHEDEGNLTGHGTTSPKYMMNENPDKTAQIGVNDFTGRDLLLEIPIISAKAENFAQSKKGKRKEERKTAQKTLEHCLNDRIPQTRQKYNTEAKNEQRCSESSVVEYHFVELKNADNCYASNNMVGPDILERHRQKKDFFDKSSARSQRHKIKCNQLNPQDKITCREVSTVNKMLRKIQITCSGLLGELSNLNDVLIKVISMKEKLSSLEFQVDEGKRLLQEVESDRFLMKSKLSALEKLINEEEKFLSGEVFCESGFYENVEADCEF